MNVTLAAALAGMAASASAEPMLGLLTSGRLATFDSATPGMLSTVSVTGLGASESLVSIDMRPTTGVVYGLSTTGGLYTLDPMSGFATSIGSLSVSINPFVVYGMDFNPVADLSGLPSLRITSNGNANLRVDVNAGQVGATTVDTPLTFADGGRLFGSAYTNNDTDPSTGTALYGIGRTDPFDPLNSNVPTLYRTTVPNNGVTTVVGGLGVTSPGANGNWGFDISGATGIAYATLTGSGPSGSSFYAIDLATGAATFVGAFATAEAMTGLTAITAPVPEPSTCALLIGGLAAVGFAARRRARSAIDQGPSLTS